MMDMMVGVNVSVCVVFCVSAFDVLGRYRHGSWTWLRADVYRAVVL